MPRRRACAALTSARVSTTGSRAGVRALDVLQPWQLAFEHVAAQEEDRALDKVLRGGRDVALDRQVGQERFDVWRPKRLGLALAVKEDEASHPIHMVLLRPDAVVAVAIEVPGRLGDAVDVGCR